MLELAPLTQGGDSSSEAATVRMYGNSWTFLGGQTGGAGKAAAKSSPTANVCIALCPWRR